MLGCRTMNAHHSLSAGEVRLFHMAKKKEKKMKESKVEIIVCVHFMSWEVSSEIWNLLCFTVDVILWQLISSLMEISSSESRAHVYSGTNTFITPLISVYTTPIAGLCLQKVISVFGMSQCASLLFVYLFGPSWAFFCRTSHKCVEPLTSKHFRLFVKPCWQLQLYTNLYLAALFHLIRKPN